jgi:hypothetical protein
VDEKGKEANQEESVSIHADLSVSIHADLSGSIHADLSGSIHADLSESIIACGAVRATGSERDCKTPFHVPRYGCSLLYFVFASPEASHKQRILKIAAVDSSGTLFSTHHGTPLLAIHSFA